jgi:hypothetical protein
LRASTDGFEKLIGFCETRYDDTRAKLTVEGRNPPHCTWRSTSAS